VQFQARADDLVDMAHQDQRDPAHAAVDRQDVHPVERGVGEPRQPPLDRHAPAHQVAHQAAHSGKA
jgi:hypothetical protein